MISEPGEAMDGIIAYKNEIGQKPPKDGYGNGIWASGNIVKEI